MENKKIAIGCDHAGFKYKEALSTFLKEKGYEVLDKGTYSEDSVDYPDFVHPVAKAIESEEASLGILICGSGNGVSMAANKHEHIRAALCWNLELASLARQHNNANVLSIPARFVDVQTAMAMTNTFLVTDFEGGRHLRRVNKINIPS